VCFGFRRPRGSCDLRDRIAGRAGLAGSFVGLVLLETCRSVLTKTRRSCRRVLFGFGFRLPRPWRDARDLRTGRAGLAGLFVGLATARDLSISSDQDSQVVAEPLRGSVNVTATCGSRLGAATAGCGHGWVRPRLGAATVRCGLRRRAAYGGGRLTVTCGLRRCVQFGSVRGCGWCGLWRCAASRWAGAA
jgi:hypothetical protein